MPTDEEHEPVRRPEEPVTVTHLTQTNSGGIPSEWHGVTAENEPVYIRFRSGHIEVRVGGKYGVDGEDVLDMFVGGEWPGTSLYDSEVLDIIRGVRFIDFDDRIPPLGDAELERQQRKFREFVWGKNREVPSERRL